MARHETILKRVPQEKLDMFGHIDMSDRTVAAYQARWGREIKCAYCDEMIETTGLDRLWERWGPDTVITVSHHWSLEPGDPREPPPNWAEMVKCILPREYGENGTGSGPAGK